MSGATRVTQTAGGSGWSKIADYAPTYGAFAALLLLLIVDSLFIPNFFHPNNFRNILLQIAPTMLVATGMTFVIATGGIDLSVGAVMAIASAVAATSMDSGAWVAVPLALCVATAGRLQRRAHLRFESSRSSSLAL